MVARVTDFDYIESVHPISDKYEVHDGTNTFIGHSGSPRYDSAFQWITFYAVVKPSGLFQRMRHWAYPDLRIKKLDLSLRKIYINGILESTDWISHDPALYRDTIIDCDEYHTKEEAFDWFRDNHPEIFEWFLFHPELF